MRWEKLQIQPTAMGGPGKRWGHTCNAIRGGKLLYVFGGYGKDNRQTNQVHVFDTATNTWTEPVRKGTQPAPRDSHSCTAVGDNLFVFGGTDGTSPLKDLHILDTSSNTWIAPSVRGEGPQAREGHSAALIGKRLLIFGGSGKSSNNSEAEYYNDLFILNTETIVWKRAETSGTPPVRRCTHTCSSWKNKLIVIGGEDSNDYYLSDVHILDTDTLVWKKLNTSGQHFPPRAGHTTVALGKNLFVFGGFADESSLYDDIYMLDVDTGVWTKVMVAGNGPSARFSSAGDILDPHKSGILILIGGCNKNLEALNDMYYLHTGLAMENEQDERRLEKLSLRKQLKLKCQEQNMLTPSVHDKALVRIETAPGTYPPTPLPIYAQPNRHNVYLNAYQPLLGRRTFQAKVTRSFQVGYTIETIIDGKLLRGVLFSNNPSSNHVEYNSKRKKAAADVDGTKLNDDHKSHLEVAITPRQDQVHEGQANDVHGHKMEAATTAMKSPATSVASQPHEEVNANKHSVGRDIINVEYNQLSDVRISGTEGHQENASVAVNSITLTQSQAAEAES